MIGGFSRPFFIRRYFIGLFLFIGLILGMVSSIVQQAQAAMNINRSINYQGRLLTNGGVNVADGVYAIKFSIYNVASAGTALWTASGTTAVPTSISIQVTDGLFSVLLGDTTFQGQNPFAFDFNQDGLYLGVSIAGDSEMTPRKRLSSVPYAFNSEALQGQFASSTDISGTSGTGTLFALNQASTTAASATRTTLLIETAGTSDFFDYLLRAKPKNGADVFSISRQGNVTSTGNFLIGDAPTDLFTVNAHINSDLIPSQDLVYSLGSASLRWNAQLGTVTSTDIFNSGTVSSTNLIVSGNTTLNNVTTTNLYNSGTVSTTQLFVNGTQISGGVPATTATLQTITTNGATTTHLMYAQGGIFSSASSTFTSDLTVLGQTSLQMLSFTNATGTAVTTTSLYVSGTASTSQLFVNGSTVCLANGINCPNTSTSSTWQYNLTNNIAYLTTSTMDVLMGGNTTATAGFIWDADTQGTSTLIIGGSTNTNVLVGTSTYGGGLSTNFGLNGNDLLAQGMIGSIEGLFSATGVSVGQGTVFADGNIYRTDGGIQFSPAAGFVVTSTSDILPSVDNSLSLGSNAYRWKGNFSTINAKNLTLANSGFNLDVVSSISVSSTAVDLINIKSFGRYVYGVSFVDNNLYIIDVFDPAFPKVINIIPIGAISPFDLDVDGKYVYVCSYTGGDLRIFDVADPLNASLLSTTTIGTGSLNGCRVKGKHVYLTNDDTDLLSVVDVTDARSPKIVSFGIPGYLGARGISIRGNYAYLAAKDTQVLNIVDISNPNIPVVVGTSTVLGDTWQVEVNSAVAVVTNYTSSTISVLDISQPSNPVLKSTLSLAGQPLIGKLTGNIFYTSLSGSADIIAIDVSSTTNPFVMATGTIPQPSPSAYGVDVSGQHIFVADETDGTLTIFKMSGISAQSLYSDSAQFGSLHVDQNAQIFGALTIGTSLQIGSGGIISNGALGISSTNTTSTILFAVSSTVGEFSNRLTVGGVNVCLADGTNCQSGGGGVTSSTWQYSLTDNIAYLTTSTMDVLMGGNTTDTAGFIWDADTQGTSTLIIGGTTNTNLLVGTTTYSGGLSSGFQLNGNDLFTQGKIGSIEGLFSATGVSVGTGTTVYADGNIYRTSGGIQFSPGSGANVSSTSNFVPTVDGSLSLGTSAFRWNAVLGAATATNVTTTNLFASGSVSTTNLSVGGFSVCLANGSNCPASSGSSTWQYNKTSNIAFLTTSTQDVLMGGGNTTSSALFVVDYRGN
ncbi:hypothetical protein IT408_03020, partial [Candidatus Uhrbacteria bacterium]|nr:hypothetical protein [Candidatus Uhrbacteria bacterium]